MIARNRSKTERFTSLAQPLAAHPRVRDFRNQGMIWAFEVDSENPCFARDLHRQALQQEILLRPIGNTVYFMPPYVLEESEWRMLLYGSNSGRSVDSHAPWVAAKLSRAS